VNRRFDIAKKFNLTKVEVEIIRLEYEGFTIAQIAEQLNISVQAIYRHRKKPNFRDALIAFDEFFNVTLLPRAYKTKLDLLSANSESVRLAAAQDIEDRVGRMKRTKVIEEKSLPFEELDSLSLPELEVLENELRAIIATAQSRREKDSGTEGA
jgi:predicted DNA-binding protein YlxM (UPF0122 family)